MWGSSRPLGVLGSRGCAFAVWGDGDGCAGVVNLHLILFLLHEILVSGQSCYSQLLNCLPVDIFKIAEEISR